PDAEGPDESAGDERPTEADGGGLQGAEEHGSGQGRAAARAARPADEAEQPRPEDASAARSARAAGRRHMTVLRRRLAGCEATAGAAGRTEERQASARDGQQAGQ